MAASNPPVNGIAYIVYVALQDMANPGSYKAAPTLATGDVKVSIDGGAFANLGTLPVVTPGAGIAVKTSLSAAEMTGDNIFVQFIDQTNPKEWADYAFTIQTVAAVWNVGKTGYALSAAGVQAIWDALTSALTTVGSIGKRLADNIDAAISSRSTYAGGAVASVTGSVGSVAAGGIAAASFAAGAIDANAIATDAIGANEVSAAAVTKIQAGLATPTNITAGVITTVTNLTNAPTAGDLTATMKASVTTAATAATPVAASVTGNVGGNVVGSVGSVVATVTANTTLIEGADATDAIAAAALAAITTYDAATAADVAALNNLSSAQAQAASAAALVVYDAATGADVAAIPAAPTTAAIADKVLGRNLAGGSDGGRTVQDALRVLRNKRSIAAGTLTVMQEDDATPAWTAAVTTAASNPLSSVDPA